MDKSGKYIFLSTHNAAKHDCDSSVKKINKFMMNKICMFWAELATETIFQFRGRPTLNHSHPTPYYIRAFFIRFFDEARIVRYISEVGIRKQQFTLLFPFRQHIYQILFTKMVQHSCVRRKRQILKQN